MMRGIGQGLAVCAAGLLVGCGTLPSGDHAPVDERPEYTDVTSPATSIPPAVPPPVPERPAVNGAARSLMDKADAAATNGDFERALALLERAQRLDPDSGEIYLFLAKTYRAKGDLAMAGAVAERGMLYCAGVAQCDALRAHIN